VKALEQAQKDWHNFDGQTFNCQADADKALVQFNLSEN
jgi:hypothetical protein